MTSWREYVMPDYVIPTRHLLLRCCSPNRGFFCIAPLLSPSLLSPFFLIWGVGAVGVVGGSNASEFLVWAERCRSNCPLCRSLKRASSRGLWTSERACLAISSLTCDLAVRALLAGICSNLQADFLFYIGCIVDNGLDAGHDDDGFSGASW